MAIDMQSVNEAFRLCYAGAALEEEALRLPGVESNRARQRAAECYAKAADSLWTLRKGAKGRSAAVLTEMLQFMVERLEGLKDDGQSDQGGNGKGRVSDAVKDEKRRKAAQELLDTERTYLAGLRKMIDFYYIPLQRTGVLSDEEAMIAFASCSQILGLSEQIEEQLTARLATWDDDKTTLGDVLLTFADFLKMYIPFASNFTSGQSILQRKSLDSITAQAAGSGVPPLDGLRITPIQRIPRYLLLVQELLKQTTDDHPDKELLQRAHEKIKLVAQETNARLQASEMQAKVLAIQSSLWAASGTIPELVAPGRILIKEGPVSKIRHGGGLKRNFYLFCFNDIVVYATTTPLVRNRYHFHRALDYYGAFPADQEVKQLGIVLSYGDCAFKITGSNGYRIFVASSEAERKDWLSALTESAEVKERKRLSWGKARGELLDDEGDDSNEDE